MLLPKLNFPEYQFSARQTNGKVEIFDIVRKKYVALSPEEWVRQNVVHYLHQSLEYPLELIQVEGSIIFNSMPKRCDIIVYNNALKPLLLVECKKPEVRLQQKTFDQALIYNMVLDVPYILITNGMSHCCFSYDKAAGRVLFHSAVPDWPVLQKAL